MTDNDQVLFEIKKSRKAFLTEYLCGGLLIILVMWSFFSVAELPPLARPLLIGVALFAVVSAETSRQFVRYLFTPAKIVVVKGFLKQSRKNVYYHSLAFVPDLSIHQTRMQRILGYGKIHCYGGGGLSEAFDLTDIDNPKEVLDHIEELVAAARIPQQPRKAVDEKPKHLLNSKD